MDTNRWLSRGLVYGPYLCLCLTQEDLDEAMDHCHVPRVEPRNSDGTCYVLEKPGNNGLVCAIWINPDRIVGRELSDILGLIVHEATHVKQHIMEHFGEDKPSVEFEAYTIQNIFNTLADEFMSRVQLKNYKGIYTVKNLKPHTNKKEA